ncbi:hypothetical protein acdb102_47440 [Acidothermaceae bacterium B102]|nr:hypothetical protein acdb102_47440 [Acidothermaceae bacterium B102]
MRTRRALEQVSVVDLDAATVLRLGGWNPRYVRVLFIAQSGDVAIALVDADSDTNLDVLERDGGGEWQAGSSGSVNDEGPGMIDPAAYDYGHAPPGTQVTVDYLDATYLVEADANGWWAFLAEYDHERDEQPRARRPGAST